MPHECCQGESKQTRAQSSQGQAASALGSEFLISQRISGNLACQGSHCHISLFSDDRVDHFFCFENHEEATLIFFQTKFSSILIFRILGEFSGISSV